MRDARWFRSMALRYLAGHSPYSGTRYGKSITWNSLEELEQIKELAETIRARRARRGQQTFKRTTPDRNYHYRSDAKGSCSYCWPECGSIHFRHGRISRTRLSNPKRQVAYFDDWRELWEEENTPSGYIEISDLDDHYDLYDYDPEMHETCFIKALSTGQLTCMACIKMCFMEKQNDKYYNCS